MGMEMQLEKAKKLMQRIPVIASNVFDEGNMRRYLDMCVSIDYLEYYNQLLIYQQYPNARIVAGIRSWEKYMTDSAAQVAKNNFSRLGLDIIVPFRFGTTTENIKLEMITVKVLDISQTNVANFSLPPDSYAPNSSEHLKLLVEAISAVITNEFHMRVLYELPDRSGKISAYPPGTITRFTVTVKDHLTEYETVLWLVEALSELYYKRIQKEGYTEEVETLFILSICYMLFRRWKLPHPEVYLPNKALIKTVPKALHEEYFIAIEECYRLLEGSIQAVYHYKRFGTEEDLDDFGMDFLHF